MNEYRKQIYIEEMTKKMLVVVWSKQGFLSGMFSKCKQCGQGIVLGTTECCHQSLCNSCAKQATTCASFEFTDKKCDPWRYNADMTFTCPYCAYSTQADYSEQHLVQV